MATVCSLFVFNSRPNHKETCWPFRVIKNRFFFQSSTACFLEYAKTFSNIEGFHLHLFPFIYISIPIICSYVVGSLLAIFATNVVFDKVLVIICIKKILNFFIHIVFFANFSCFFCIRNHEFVGNSQYLCVIKK